MTSVAGRRLHLHEAPARIPGVPPMFSLRDPDGNTLYVVEQP